MMYPTLELHGKPVLILNGFGGSQGAFSAGAEPIDLIERAKLQICAANNPDAVAFTYFRGRWRVAI